MTSEVGTRAEVSERALDPTWFRRVLGQYPTGVSVVTAMGEDGAGVGFVVGSFSSLSLDPPMVAFFPDKRSTTWPKIERAGRFCVNVLGADQEALCRRFAAKGDDKFAGLDVAQTPSGTPVLQDSVAWIEAEVESVVEAGDHYVVTGRVLDLDAVSGASPLLFFQGGYGRFASHSVAETDRNGDLTGALRAVELIRSDLEQLAVRWGAQVYGLAVDDGDVVVVARAAAASAAPARGTLVGLRLPFSAPLASVLAAWSPPETVARWMTHLPSVGAREVQEEHLAAVRRRGYSVGLQNQALDAMSSALDTIASGAGPAAREELFNFVPSLEYDPDADQPGTLQRLRMVSAPVFDAAGEVVIAVNVLGFDEPTSPEDVQRVIASVREVTERATVALAED